MENIKGAQAGTSNTDMNKLNKSQVRRPFPTQILVLITTPKLANDAENILKLEGHTLLYRFYAEGTASSEIMDMLGLGSIDKSVLVSIVSQNASASLMNRLYSELHMYKANSGIAFTIPLNGVNNLILKALDQNKQSNCASGPNYNETRNENMSESKHSLIAAVVNRGFSGDVMEAVRAAGARGGTVIHSRQITNEEASSFWGAGMQEEKEIILILSESANKIDLMKCISEHCGMHSEAQGIVMSLPIDSVVGF